MANFEMNGTELAKIMTNLSELYAWEMENLPFFRSSTGRHIYFGLVRRSMSPDAKLDASLKDLFATAHFTDRALRTRMQAMVDDGLVETVGGLEDARMKYLMPNEKFYKNIYDHGIKFKKIMNKDFLLLEK